MNTLSAFLVELYADDIVAVYNTLVPRPIYFAKDYWLAIKSGEAADEPIIRELRRRKVFVLPAEDDRLLAKAREDALSSEGVSILYLILTDACNFRCAYCFQEERHGKSSGPLMTREVARQGLDLFIKNLRPEDYAVQIQLYGGEPLLNWDVFVFSVDYIHAMIERGSLPRSTKIIMLTNGSLLDETKAAFIKAANIELGLSIDGPAEYTNLHRKYTSGKPAYDTVIDALALIKRHKIPTMLSITVSPDNVAKLPDLVSWAQNTGVESIGFNPIGGKSYGYVSRNMVKVDYDRLLTSSLIKAFRKTSQYGMYEDRIGRKVAVFVKKGFIFSDCGAINSQLVVHPDGKIGYCHASRQYDVGDVSDAAFTIYNKGTIPAWREALPINRDGCMTCPAISLCGYGCFHNVIEEKGDVSFMDRQFCSYTRELMTFLVWELYNASRQ